MRMRNDDIVGAGFDPGIGGSDERQSDECADNPGRRRTAGPAAVCRGDNGMVVAIDFDTHRY